MVTTTADLNLHPDLNGNVKIFCSQYDNALREIVFNIYDGDTLADLTDLTAKVEGTKPDKYGYSYDATISTSNSTVTVTLVTQMTCVAGLSHAEIVLYDDDSRVGTANFLLMVEEAGISDDTIVSDSVIPGIHNIDTLVEYAQTYADNAEASALKAEGYAAGTQNGTEVESGSEYYENNAKYYCEQAYSASPEGYAELVEQVSTNTTNISTNTTNIATNTSDISNILTMIADEWSATKTYSYGMWLHYDGILYKVIKANTVFYAITPPNTTYYEEKSITDALAELSDAIGSEYSSMNEYSVGAIFRYEGSMYKVDVACTGITPPNSNYYTATTLASLIAENASDISTLNSSLTNNFSVTSNTNLLDNPWFTINQRGESSYSNIYNAYGLDRWKNQSLSEDVLTINDDGTITYTLNGNSGGVKFLWQPFDTQLQNIINSGVTKITLSVDIVSQSSDNGFAFAMGLGRILIDKTATGIVSCTYNVGSFTPIGCGLSLYNRSEESGNATITIRSMKLEVGSVSTLANDTAPNYQQELAKCQRYYVRYKYPNASSNYVNIAIGMMFGTNMSVPINLPTSMRTIPTVHVSDISSFRAQLSSGGNVATAIAVSTYDEDVNYVNLRVTLTTSMDNGRMGIFQTTVNNAWIDFSADL